jgi:hypothetical protein
MEKVKSNKINIAMVLLTVLFSIVPAFVLNATPSTVFWTPCTVYFQPFLKGRNYFSILSAKREGVVYNFQPFA